MDTHLVPFVDDEVSTRVVSERDEIRVSDIIAVIMGDGLVVLIDCDRCIRDVYIGVGKVYEEFVEIGADPALAREVWGHTSLSDYAECHTPSIPRAFSVVVESDGLSFQLVDDGCECLFGNLHIRWRENKKDKKNILMLGRFGRTIWRQSREISVYNYEKVMVYEIYTNQGYVCVSQNKTDNKVEVLNGLALCAKNDENRKSQKDREASVFFSTLE
jgi:hypothetical protein